MIWEFNIADISPVFEFSKKSISCHLAPKAPAPSSSRSLRSQNLGENHQICSCWVSIPFIHTVTARKTKNTYFIRLSCVFCYIDHQDRQNCSRRAAPTGGEIFVHVRFGTSHGFSALNWLQDRSVQLFVVTFSDSSCCDDDDDDLFLKYILNWSNVWWRWWWWWWSLSFLAP